MKLRNIQRFIPKAALPQLREVYFQAENYFRFGDRHFIRDIALETSAACNRSCHYCPQSVLPMKQKLVEWDVVECFAHRIRELEWTGTVNFHFYNEPLLNPKLRDIVECVTRANPQCKPQIFTNGDRLTEDVMLQFFAAGLQNFVVSRHIPFSDKWDNRIFSLIKKYPNQISLYQPEDHVWKNRGGLMKDLPGKNGLYHAKTCNAPAYVNITIAGQVLLCCCDYKKDYVVGDIKKQSFMEIWNDAKFKQLRRDILNGKFETPLCKACTETE
jgi:2-deoxy-scyllo-inosamine dehydrogenase (SAM-dependent)